MNFDKFADNANIEITAADQISERWPGIDIGQRTGDVFSGTVKIQKLFFKNSSV